MQTPCIALHIEAATFLRFVMAAPLQVTWLLPVLNGMPYIPETLASIAAQTFKNFEVIVWDNGSTDGTVEVLREWIPRKLPGRVVTGRPLDLGACLAEMVKLSASPYCARIDADDVNLPERLETQVAFLERNPGVAVVGTQVNHLSTTGAIGGPYHHLPLTHEAIAIRLLREWSVWHPTVLFRREVVLQAGNYLDERPVEDYSLWLRVARLGRLANLPAALVNYRVHESSVTERARREGVLGEKTGACVARHGAPLYGLAMEDVRQLRSGKIPSLSQMTTMFAHLRRHHARAVPLCFELLRQLLWAPIRRQAGRRFKRMAGLAPVGTR